MNETPREHEQFVGYESLCQGDRDSHLTSIGEDVTNESEEHCDRMTNET